MKTKRTYYGFNVDDSKTIITEYCDQPIRDLVVYRLYDLYTTFVWKTKIERLQDKIWWHRHPGTDLVESLERPSVAHDLKHYDLSVANLTVLHRKTEVLPS